MANFGPQDQVTDYAKAFTVYDFPTGTYVPFDFSGAYGADAILNVAANGQVQIFGTDQSGATITVKIGGANVALDGTGSAFALRAHANGLTCYFQYNLPNTQNQTYFFKAVFSKTSAAVQQTVTWQNSTLQ